MSFKHRVHEVVFEADTFGGKVFDIVLLITICLSVLSIILESVDSVQADYVDVLNTLEWIFTVLFTIEYALRIYCLENPRSYIFSFYGIIDFLAIVPTYLSIVFVDAQYLLAIRTFRLLRIYRILKLVRYIDEVKVLMGAIKASMRKITVFLAIISVLIVIIATTMYVIEGEENGFTSIPKSIYWTIVTLTTVGYGDVSPQTYLGQAFASLIMLLGYGVIAVPTGIVTVELAERKRGQRNTQSCEHCGFDIHDDDAAFCKKCGMQL